MNSKFDMINYFLQDVLLKKMDKTNKIMFFKLLFIRIKNISNPNIKQRMIAKKRLLKYPHS